MTDISQKNVVVVGGGLSGLSAALEVRRVAQDRGLPVKVTVLERDDHVGGKIGSVRKDGFLCETGPNGFLDNKPATMALVGRMGVEDKLLKSNDDARKRYVFCDGRLQRIPEDPVSFATSELMSIRGKIRLAAEMFLPQGEPGVDETVAQFVRRRLGQEALDKLIDPMAAGVYAGDPSMMSLQSCFPKVAMIEQQFGGLLRGMLAMQKMAKARGQEGPQSAGPTGVLWSFGDGTVELPKMIADKLAQFDEGSVRTSTSAVALDREGSGWTVKTDKGDTLAADAVVLAAPAYDAAVLVRPHLEEGAKMLSNIPYVPTAIFCIGYNREDIEMPLDGFGFLIPTKEGRQILGSLWSSSIFASRAPDGKVLFTLIVGGARNPELVGLSDDELEKVCRAELQVTMGIKAAPVFSFASKWARAIPQYMVGHAERVAKLEAQVAALGGLHLGGNSFYGIGINDCTARAEVLGPMVVDGILEGRQ
jgi:oxygen-dependent protoporphyrinogen oxidase